VKKKHTTELHRSETRKKINKQKKYNAIKLTVNKLVSSTHCCYQNKRKEEKHFFFVAKKIEKFTWFLNVRHTVLCVQINTRKTNKKMNSFMFEVTIANDVD
jgi:hypothetical protein